MELPPGLDPVPALKIRGKMITARMIRIIRGTVEQPQPPQPPPPGKMIGLKVEPTGRGRKPQPE
jgi:hypothetical protein